MPGFQVSKARVPWPQLKNKKPDISFFLCIVLKRRWGGSPKTFLEKTTTCFLFFRFFLFHGIHRWANFSRGAHWPFLRGGNTSVGGILNCFIFFSLQNNPSSACFFYPPGRAPAMLLSAAKRGPKHLFGHFGGAKHGIGRCI